MRNNLMKSIPLFKARSAVRPDQVTQGFTWSNLESLWAWRLQNLLHSLLQHLITPQGQKFHLVANNM